MHNKRTGRNKMMNSSTQLTSKMVDVIFNKPLQVTVEDNMLVIVQPSGGVATANLNWFNKKTIKYAYICT